MPFNASCHKDQEYIWFRGGNLNGLQDIRHFDFPHTNAYDTKFDLCPKIGQGHPRVIV